MKVYEIISEPRVQLDENWLKDTIKWLFKSGAKGASKEAVLSFIKHSSEEYANVLLQAEKRGIQPPDLVKFLDEQAKGATGGKQGFMDMDPAFTSKETLDLINSNARKILKDLRKGATAKAGETVANRFARRYGTSIAIKESLGVLQTTWLTANVITTTVILWKPLSTYATNMAAARKYLELGDEGFQQLKNAGQLEGMTIDGQSPQNVEEWFVLYNHAQLQVCVAKLAEALTVTFVVSLVGYGVFRGLGKFIPGVKKLTNLAAPAAFNLYLNAMMQDPEPGKVMLGIVMNTWLGKATWAADIYQKFRIPSEGEARARYNAVVDKVNKGIESGGKDNKEAEPTTPIGQGGKYDTTNGATTQEPNVTTPDEQPAVATPVDKSTWKRDWQGYPINPATGNAELDN